MFELFSEISLYEHRPTDMFCKNYGELESRFRKNKKAMRAYARADVVMSTQYGDRGVRATG